MLIAVDGAVQSLKPVTLRSSQEILTERFGAKASDREARRHDTWHLEHQSKESRCHTQSSFERHVAFSMMASTIEVDFEARPAQRATVEMLGETSKGGRG